MLDAWGVEDDVDRSFNNRLRPIESGAGRQLQDRDEVTLVLLRDETRRGACKLHARETDQQRVDHEHNAHHLQKTPRQTAIGVRHPFEAAIEALEARPKNATWPGGTRLMGRLIRLEKHRAQSWTECQRDKAGDHGRGRDRDRELAKELAREARHESGWDYPRGHRTG